MTFLASECSCSWYNSDCPRQAGLIRLNFLDWDPTNLCFLSDCFGTFNLSNLKNLGGCCVKGEKEKRDLNWRLENLILRE